MSTTPNNRPAAPEDIADEALLEWHRVCDELDAIGKLAKADRAVIALYCRTHAVHAAVYKHVSKHGPVIKWSNGVPGQGPWYKTQKETTALLCKLLDQLGLTPSSRTIAAAAETSDELTF